MDGWSINIPGLQFSSIQFFDNQGQTTELLFSLIRKTRKTKKIDVRQWLWPSARHLKEVTVTAFK